MAIILWPKQEFFFFCPKVSSLPSLLNAGDVKNAGANPQPYDTKIRGGGGELVALGLLENNKLFF